ncbi:MAG: O-antigen ligase family protein [Deltaproteobacteria bacterium]|nr:O-antigen ligase family protein [Deltaproteobacteria bacterium]
MAVGASSVRAGALSAFFASWVGALVFQGAASPRAIWVCGIVFLGLGVGCVVWRGRDLGAPLGLVRAIAFLDLIALLQLLPVDLGLFDFTREARRAFGVSVAAPGTADLVSTMRALSQWHTYALAALVVHTLVAAGIQRSTLIRAFVIVVAALGLYGLLQWSLGFETIPFYGKRIAAEASATFVNPNSFGGFVAVGCVLAFDRALAERRITWLLPALVCLAALLATHSRGAIAAAGVGISVSVVVRHRAAGVALGAGAVAASVAFLGRDLADSMAGRMSFWSASLAGLERQPVLGFGLGAFRYAFRPFAPEGTDLSVLHPHNEFLNLLFETGVVGALGATLFGLSWLRLVLRTSSRKVAPDLVGALTCSAVHACVDFDWQITAIGILVASLMTLSVEGCQRAEGWTFARTLALLSSAVVSSALFGLALYSIPRPREDFSESDAARALRLSPFAVEAAFASAATAERRGDRDTASERFERASALWPAHGGLAEAVALRLIGLGALDRATRVLKPRFLHAPHRIAAVLGNDTVSRLSIEDRARLVPLTPIPRTYFAAYLARRGEWEDAMATFDAIRFDEITPEQTLSAYDAFAAELGQADLGGLEAKIRERRLALPEPSALPKPSTRSARVMSRGSALAAAALAWERLDALDRALPFALEAANEEPWRPERHQLLGRLRERLFMRLDALDSYSRWIELEPKSLPARVARASLASSLDQLDLAESDLRAALALRPEDSANRLLLARLLARKGDLVGAETELHRILSRDSGHAGALSELDVLRKVRAPEPR